MLTVDGRNLRLQALKCRLDGGPPGNSLAALDACLDAGVDAMEADVCALADGEFVVTDGPDLARETTGEGPAGTIDSGAAGGLRLLERGRVTDHRVPLLRELLARHRGPGRLQLDLKDERLPASVLDALACQLEPHAGRLIVGGRCAPNLRALHERLPGLAIAFDPSLLLDLRRGAYVGSLASAPVGSVALEETFERLWCEAPRADVWCLRAALVARLADDRFDAVGWLRGRGADVDAWTIDVQPGPGKRQWSVDLLRRVAGLGATQVTTSTPLAWLALRELSAL